MASFATRPLRALPQAAARDEQGARRRHASWGDGSLTGIQKDGDDVVVTVNFAAVGRKRLLLKYAPLEEV